MFVEIKLRPSQKAKLEALYEVLSETHLIYMKAFQTKNRAKLGFLEDIFYQGLRGLKIDTDLISEDAVETSNATTKDHLLSPGRYTHHFFTNIKEMSLEQFIEEVKCLGLVITVTREENTQLSQTEKRNKKENNFVLDKYKQMGITLHRGYETYNCVPDDIIAMIPEDLKSVTYAT